MSSKEAVEMTKIDSFKETINIDIMMKRGMMNRDVESIRNCVDNDPVAFADQILSYAEDLSRLKNEIINLKSTLSMLDAIEASE